MIQPVECSICGKVYEDGVPDDHGEHWLVEISECPVVGVYDRRFKTFRKCDDGDHHWGRGDHVAILKHKNGVPKRALVQDSTS